MWRWPDVGDVKGDEEEEEEESEESEGDVAADEKHAPEGRKTERTGREKTGQLRRETLSLSIALVFCCCCWCVGAK